MGTLHHFPADRIVRRQPMTMAAPAAVSISYAPRPAPNHKDAIAVSATTTSDGRRCLGHNYDGLLRRWYRHPSDTVGTNRLIDAVITAFNRWCKNGKAPKTKGWCDYQHQLYELLVWKQTSLCQ